MVFLWFSYEKWWFWRDELGMGMVDMTIVWIFIQFLEDLRSMESMGWIFQATFDDTGKVSWGESTL